jgi:hypothetical protein
MEEMARKTVELESKLEAQQKQIHQSRKDRQCPVCFECDKDCT